MTLVIANNVSSLNAQHQLTQTSRRLAQSLERLSSGLKVNRGADGPATLVISEKQRAQIAGLKKAIENSEKAISLVQTAEGALNEINTLLIKIRGLALDSSNEGVNDEDALNANQAELTNALETIDRIAGNTQFGTKHLLNGNSGITGIVSDPDDVTFLKATTDTVAGNYTITVTTPGARANRTAPTDQTGPLANDETLTVNGVTIELTSGLTQAQVINRINDFTSQTGVVAEDTASGTRLRTVQFGEDATLSVVSNQANTATSTGFGTTSFTGTGTNIEGTFGADSFVGKGNVITSTSGATDGLSLQFATNPTDSTSTITGAQGSVTIVDRSLAFQIGPNQNQTATIAIPPSGASSLGLGTTGNRFSHLGEVSILSFEESQDALTVIDAAIDEVTNMRGELGAFQQNTLESTTNNLRATLENTVNAESVIRDTDFAEEIAEFTKMQVLVQAGTSVLGNANQLSQLALGLLQ